MLPYQLNGANIDDVVIHFYNSNGSPSIADQLLHLNEVYITLSLEGYLLYICDIGGT